MPIVHSTRSICLLPFLGLLACSHDSTRDNPLDPALTPPVSVQVSVDDSAATATVSWTGYEGVSAFGEYRVLRNVADRVTVDTLAILMVNETTYVDSSLAPEVAYAYRVVVVNASGFEAESAAQIVRLQQHPPVHLGPLQFESRTASVAVSWATYDGRNFSSYRLVRSTGVETQLVKETGERLDTTFVDGGLTGGREYAYRVDVLIEGGATIEGTSRNGAFHQLVDSWPLGMGDEAYVQLYKRNGSLLALVSEPQHVRVVTFETDGTVLGEQTRLQHRWLNILPGAPPSPFSTTAASTSVSSEDRLNPVVPIYIPRCSSPLMLMACRCRENTPYRNGMSSKQSRILICQSLSPTSPSGRYFSRRSTTSSSRRKAVC